MDMGQGSQFYGTTPGGMQVYGPTSFNEQYDWGTFGQNLGSGLSQSAQNFRMPQQSVPAMGGVPQFSQSPIGYGNSNAPTYIPQANIQDVIMRILGGVY